MTTEVAKHAPYVVIIIGIVIVFAWLLHKNRELEHQDRVLDRGESRRHTAALEELATAVVSLRSFIGNMERTSKELIEAIYLVDRQRNESKIQEMLQAKQDIKDNWDSK